MLGGPRGHVPDRRRAVHAPLRLLPDRHRQAGRTRPRRAAQGRRERRDDGPALRHRHRRRARRPARRRCVAVRRDGALHQEAQPRHRRRVADPRLQRRARQLLEQVFESRPEVLAHNVETVPRIFKRIRPAFRYDRSLDVLTAARDYGLVTKSNLILGMGETPDEVRTALRTCTTPAATSSPSPSTCGRRRAITRWNAGCTPEEFVEHAAFAEELGFAGVLAGPLVRSSYRAGRLYAQAAGVSGRGSAHPYPEPMAKTATPPKPRPPRPRPRPPVRPPPSSAAVSCGRRSRSSAKRTSACCRT